ncbi:MAG TPA: flagellar basal body rod C-terminal domain-containing protein [Acidimicrobiales bacterium]|nr:flagellar basal body rod C-terminal domain-containing protein [Acidimicrobiales bacterium]
MWEAIDIAGSGASVDQTWIDAIGGNVANMNDAATPGQPVYQAQYIDAAAQVEADGSGDGVRVQSIELGPSQGEEVYDPTNPAADASGDVEYPVVDLGEQMTDLIESQTSYQANSAVMSHATSAYQSILDIKA